MCVCVCVCVCVSGTAGIKMVNGWRLCVLFSCVVHAYKKTVRSMCDWCQLVKTACTHSLCRHVIGVVCSSVWCLCAYTNVHIRYTSQVTYSFPRSCRKCNPQIPTRQSAGMREDSANTLQSVCGHYAKNHRERFTDMTCHNAFEAIFFTIKTEPSAVTTRKETPCDLGNYD